jgi:uncharacterized membrane protein (DUF2068 family)
VKHANDGPKPSAKTSVGLRTVAAFEAAKGGIVLLLGCGVLDLIRKNLDAIAERLAEVLHVNPDGKLSNLFVKLASHATDRLLWMLAIGAPVYAAVRSVEAYGLWREREWAQWFALLSTALYLPPELYWLLGHPTWLKCSALITAASGGGPTAPQAVALSSTLTGQLLQAKSDTPWLMVPLGVESAPQNLQVYVDPSSLAPGKVSRKRHSPDTRCFRRSDYDSGHGDGERSRSSAAEA